MSYRYYILPCLLVLLLLSSPAWSQDKKRKRATSSTYRTGMDSTQFWLDRARERYTTAPLEAFDLVEKALLKSIVSNNEAGQAESYYLLGQINRSLQQYQLAANYAARGLDLYTRNEDLRGVALSNWLQARIARERGAPETALTGYESLLQRQINELSIPEQITLLNELGELLLTLGREAEAEQRFGEVLALEQASANRKGQSAAYRNIGRALEQQQQEQQAIALYNQSLEVATADADTAEQLLTSNQLADLLSKQGRLEEELNLRQQNIILANTIDQAPDTKEHTTPKRGKNRSKLQLGDLYRKLDSEAEAASLYAESAGDALAVGDLNTASEAFKSLSISYNRLGKVAEARASFEQYMVLKDSVLQQQESQMLASLELTRSINQQQQKIDLLQKDVELNQRRMELFEQQAQLQEANLNRQQLIIAGLLLVIVLVLLGLYFFWKSARQKRIANQLMALRSLRSQMNPHFIFNALNSVNNYIAKNDERAANRYLADFSRLMRAVLENSRHDLVPLASEVQIIQLYLELEHLRFKDKFDYTFEVEDSLDLQEVEIPPMLIQPYIENAIWHGLRYLEHKGELTVHISPEAEQGLLVTVQDSGIGRSRSAALKTAHQQEAKSTGMQNTASRLQIINEMYGTDLSITVTDAFADKEACGTLVQISIPYRTKLAAHDS